MSCFMYVSYNNSFTWSVSYLLTKDAVGDPSRGDEAVARRADTRAYEALHSARDDIVRLSEYSCPRSSNEFVKRALER
jgi:hypothetical protein